MELGQLVFGNPTQEYDIDDFGRALLLQLIDEIRRVFWNVNQREWDYREDPEIAGIVYRPYYWGDDEHEAALPNFAFGGVQIAWYKHPGRSMTINKNMTAEEWRSWFTLCLRAIEAKDDS